MKKVRYFVCKAKMVGNTRIPEIIEYFEHLPVSWSAVYYPSLQKAELVCVRIEYDEKVLQRMQEGLNWLRRGDLSNELKEDKDWERVKGKFRKDMWRGNGRNEVS